MNECNAKRVVVLVDMDCFYCQVEVQHNPSLAGKPVAVVQYNSWRGGGIIAVNYEARAKGVDRHMRGDDAVQKCPDLNLVRVKEHHGKADLSKYRTASQKVFEVLSEFSPCVQRASIDEAYVDLTSVVNDYIISSSNNVITITDLPNTFIEGYSDHNSLDDREKSMKAWLQDVYNNELQDENLLRLTIGAMMVEKLRESIFKKTGFRCSAGIANNKILAKLSCGLHKPNQQTLLPPCSVPHLFQTIPIKKVRNLGGKLGNKVRKEFNCEFMSELAAISLNDLRKKFDDKTCNFLYQVSKGIDNEPVESRLINKSIGSCKSFPLGLKVKDEVHHWLSTLMNDIVEKLEADYIANKRKATLMTVSVRYSIKETNLPTSQCSEVNTYNHNKLLDMAYSMLCTMTENQKSINWKNPLSFLGVAIGKFMEVNVKSSIESYFNKGTTSKEEEDVNNQISRPENRASCSTDIVNDIAGSNSTISCNKILESNLKPSLLHQNQLSSSFHKINSKKVDKCSSNVKNIKTMFAEIKSANKLYDNSDNLTATVPNIETKKSNKIKTDANSFFSNKLKIISPIKNQVYENVTSTIDLASSVSSARFFSTKLEIPSPSKNGLNDKVEVVTNAQDSFFSKKLEIVSPSKCEINIDSSIVPMIKPPINKEIDENSFFSRKLEIVSPSKCETKNVLSLEPIIQLPINEENNEDVPSKLLCERCEKMVDINQYDEHYDFHVAVELSKSLNSAGTIKPSVKNEIYHGSSKKKKNGSQKRKQNSNTSSDSKKLCTSISSYFKPVLNP